MDLANFEGFTVSRFTTAPSDLETITWVIMTMSSFRIGVPCFLAALQINLARLSPFFTIGKPVTSNISIRFKYNASLYWIPHGQFNKLRFLSNNSITYVYLLFEPAIGLF